MWNRKDLKEKAKTAFKGNYWTSVIVAFILSVVLAAETGSGASNVQEQLDEMQATSGLTSNEFLGAIFAGGILAIIIGILIEMFIRNMLVVGGYNYFIKNANGEKPGAGEVLSGYKNGHFFNVFLTMFLEDLFIGLWTLLFIIPGIVKSYSYRMVPYILAEDPTIDPMTAIGKSKEMMKGSKWNAFVLDLSFIGWYIVSGLTLGIAGIFYVNPYVYATNAELYLALKK